MCIAIQILRVDVELNSPSLSECFKQIARDPRINRTKQLLAKRRNARGCSLTIAQGYDKRPRIRQLRYLILWGISLIRRNRRRRNAKDSTQRLSVCVTTGVNIDASRTAYVTVITAVTIASSAPHYPVDLVTRT